MGGLYLFLELLDNKLLPPDSVADEGNHSTVSKNKRQMYRQPIYIVI